LMDQGTGRHLKMKREKRERTEQRESVQAFTIVGGRGERGETPFWGGSLGRTAVSTFRSDQGASAKLTKLSVSLSRVRRWGSRKIQEKKLRPETTCPLRRKKGLAAGNSKNHTWQGRGTHSDEPSVFRKVNGKDCLSGRLQEWSL